MWRERTLMPPCHTIHQSIFFLSTIDSCYGSHNGASYMHIAWRILTLIMIIITVPMLNKDTRQSTLYRYRPIVRLFSRSLSYPLLLSPRMARHLFLSCRPFTWHTNITPVVKVTLICKHFVHINFIQGCSGTKQPRHKGSWSTPLCSTRKSYIDTLI